MKAQPSSVRMLPEQTILSAWREQLTQAAPGVSQTLLGQQPELLPRFAACYTKLQQLPRQVRRRLQRQFCRAGFNPPISADCAAPRPHECGPTAGYRAGHQPRDLRRQRALGSLALLLALGQAPALAATINVGGGCKLVDAITAANTDNAIGLCTAGSGVDTLALRSSSTHTLTTVNNSTPFGPTGLPVISSVIKIDGNGSTIKRGSGAPNFRIFTVNSTGDLILAQIAVSGGVSAEGGGGILNDRGKLRLFNSTLSGNRAISGGGLART